MPRQCRVGMFWRLALSHVSLSGEPLQVRIARARPRYKGPAADIIWNSEFFARGLEVRLEAEQWDFRFPAAVASLGMILLNSPHKGRET